MANNTMTSAKNQMVLNIIDARTAIDIHDAIRLYVEANLHMGFDGSMGDYKLEYRGNEIRLKCDGDRNIVITFEYDCKTYSIHLYSEGGANFFRRRDDDPFPYYNEHSYWVDNQVRRMLDNMLDVLQEENIWRWE